MVESDPDGICGLLALLRSAGVCTTTIREEIIWLYRLVGGVSSGGLVVELGTLEGVTAMAMAQAMVDRGTPGRVVTVDSQADDLRAEVCDRISQFGFADLIDVVKADDISYADSFDNRSIGLLFVDTLHTCDHVLDVLRTYSPKLRLGGVFAGHDYFPVERGVVMAVDLWRRDYAAWLSGWGLHYTVWWVLRNNSEKAMPT